MTGQSGFAICHNYSTACDKAYTNSETPSPDLSRNCPEAVLDLDSSYVSLPTEYKPIHEAYYLYSTTSWIQHGGGSPLPSGFCPSLSFCRGLLGGGLAAAGSDPAGAAPTSATGRFAYSYLLLLTCHPAAACKRRHINFPPEYMDYSTHSRSAP